MIHNLFISSIFFFALVAPGFCQKVTVCMEEDGDIRVDCRLETKQNQINSYEFSVSKNGKETVINTNVTGTTADQTFKDKTRVEQLDPYGYRLALSGFPLTENTTFICKASNVNQNALVVKGKMVACSAISVFLQSCPWLLSLLMSLHAMQSWALSSL